MRWWISHKLLMLALLIAPETPAKRELVFVIDEWGMAVEDNGLY